MGSLAVRAPACLDSERTVGLLMAQPVLGSHPMAHSRRTSPARDARRTSSTAAGAPVFSAADGAALVGAAGKTAEAATNLQKENADKQPVRLVVLPRLFTVSQKKTSAAEQGKSCCCG